MGIRISELPDKASASVDDLVPIVDVASPGSYVTKKTTIAGLVLQAIASWWSGSSDKTKLDGIESGATANQADSVLLDRTNHTGSQSISTVDGLQSALDGKVSDTAVSVSADKSLSVSNSITLSSTDGATVQFGAGGSVLYSNSTIDGGQY